MPKVVVLGCGKVGSVIACDLAAVDGFDVLAVDPSDAALTQVDGRKHINTRRADCSDMDVVTALAAESDIVVGALPSRLGFAAMEAVIRTGTSMCDISFMTDDFLSLDELAVANKATIVADCGVAPGMSNMCAGWATARLDRTDSIEILVGGVPRERFGPWEYKAGFSPYDVIEEYVRPARFVRDGELVVRDALSEPEMIDFEGVGTLEAFNTDGLRSLADTLSVPNMRERTLRYPGHIDLARAFRETGLFSEEPIEVDGVSVVPRRLLAALLFPKWTYKPMEVDLTVMRIEVEGELDGVETRLRWDLLDRLDPATGFSSMARTTGFTASVVTQLIYDQTISEHGAFAPEQIASEGDRLDTIMRLLADRGVVYDAHIQTRGDTNG